VEIVFIIMEKITFNQILDDDLKVVDKEAIEMLKGKNEKSH